MIKASALINLFQRMLDERWAYELGAAREGCVDCSGAFVWAYKQLGATIEHGSNSIAHLRVGEYVTVSEAKPGYAVFKLRPWREDDSGNRWYNQQPGDCYHIGLMGRDHQRISQHPRGRKHAVKGHRKSRERDAGERDPRGGRHGLGVRHAGKRCGRVHVQRVSG